MAFDVHIGKKQVIWGIVGAFAIGLVIGGLVMTYGIKSAPLHKKVIMDTTYVTTSVPLNLASSLKPVGVIPIKMDRTPKTDTVYVDRPYVKDSLIYVPISQGLYTKNDVSVWATGYHVTIDSVRAIVPLRERTITKTVTQSYDNELSMGVGISTMFIGSYKIPNASLEFAWDKGRNHTFAKIGAGYVDSKVNFYFETGYYIKFLRRQY